MNPYSFEHRMSRYFRDEIPETAPFFKDCYHPNRFEKVGMNLLRPIRDYFDGSIQAEELKPLTQLVYTIQKIVLFPLALLGTLLKQVGENGNPEFASWEKYQDARTKLFACKSLHRHPLTGEYRHWEIVTKAGIPINYPLFTREGELFQRARRQMNEVLVFLEDKTVIESLNHVFQQVSDLYQKVEQETPDADQLDTDSQKLEIWIQQMVDIQLPDPDKEKIEAYFSCLQGHFAKLQEGITALYPYKTKMKEAYQREWVKTLIFNTFYLKISLYNKAYH